MRHRIANPLELLSSSLIIETIAAAGLILDTAPPDTGIGVAADLAPGVTVPGIAAGPVTDMIICTAGGLLPDFIDFDPTSAWGDDDGVTATMPDGVDFDPNPFASTWGDGDSATAAIPTSVRGHQDEVITATLEAVPTQKRKACGDRSG